MDEATDHRALCAIRMKLGLTQREMAARLNTPVPTYKSWEAGRHNPPGVAITAATASNRA